MKSNDAVATGSEDPSDVACFATVADRKDSKLFTVGSSK